MIYKTTAFHSDNLWLSWWDLLRLACGRELKVSALIVKMGKP